MTIINRNNNTTTNKNTICNYASIARGCFVLFWITKYCVFHYPGEINELMAMTIKLDYVGMFKKGKYFSWVQCTMYSVHCTLYTVYCASYSVHCTLYT